MESVYYWLDIFSVLRVMIAQDYLILHYSSRGRSSDVLVNSISADYNPASHCPVDKENKMHKLAPVIVLLSILAVLLLSACGGLAADPAAKAVVGYLNALVSEDSNRLSALSCSDWESNAMLELDSLQAVSARLEGLTCATTGTDGTTSDVNCQGKILATYNDEDQELDLSVRTYQVVQQGDEYLVCGYK
jgi:hypothetical protein